ncbi:MAG: DNA mismatch repair endonuclease MutL [Treponema sp.]|nr:DNA mismatch repair endonuclease MutL [Treponema sp.]
MGEHIQVLPPGEVTKIAAGEVIDRPAALIREFLDNAIDAGGRLIETVIEGGGARRAEVIDDGTGMEKEDLELCYLAHATSKIRSLSDLESSRTLGFRGEALAAAAAAARLEILTSTGGKDAWRLEVGPGEKTPPRIEQARRTRGTTVRTLGLFDSIPARKRFLKREVSEGGLCRQALIDKALAFPEIGFRFIREGDFKDDFPPVSSLRERFARILLREGERPFLHEINLAGPGFTVVVVAGGPELYRGDRRQQYVFANRRRIYDYALLQALEYGVQGWFPNGVHPVGAVYIDIDPALADFNIHPAKREARFADPGIIHHRITAGLRDYVRRGFSGSGGPDRKAPVSPGEGDLWGGRNPRPSLGNGGDGYGRGKGGDNLALEAFLSGPPEFRPLPGRGDTYTPASGGGEAAEKAAPFYGVSERAARFVGRLFGLFLLVEKGDRFFIIDQHAAHERILYDRFLSGPIPTQELLVAISFSTESEEEDRFLRGRQENLGALGIVIEEEDGTWRVEALPAGWKLPDAETVEEILNLKNAGENMAERWAASLACHGAIRDGDYLDDQSALGLAEKALALPISRCPHGRPIWTELSREELLKAVRRI